MWNQLVNHNDDIRLLVEKGYAVSFDSDHLVIRDIPYLDENRKLQTGAIISKLIFVDKTHVKLHNHEIFFCGSHPCQIDGSPIPNLGGGTCTLTLVSDDLKVQRSFSNKPPGDFSNLFEKIESYVTIITGPARYLYDVNPLTYNVNEKIADSIFKFSDTLTSRAEIGDLALKFKDDVIAIIGLGGTGSYILDFLVKTPVKEIRGFDYDWFHVHNAFRSPGELKEEELGRKKAEVYQNRYEGFRFGIKMHTKFILADSTDELEGVTFAFVCVDKGPARKEIFDVLVKMNIPFIDVGMGLNRRKGPINGMLRSTYYPSESVQEILAKQLSPMADDPNDIYKTNIQISELNALNACLAVVRYKQLRGFYEIEESLQHMLITIGDLHLVSE